MFNKSIITCAITMVFSHQAIAQDKPQELATTKVISESIKRDAVVEVLDRDKLDELQINSYEDLIRTIPGISVAKGDDRWGSSGFNIRGLDEDRVAINVDGVAQGETLKYESGQAYGYFKGSRNGVDIEALKSIEIVKGADAILSGSGALAGAVNMTTKSPKDLLKNDGDDSTFGFKTGFSGENDEAMLSLSGANRNGNLESLFIYTRRDASEYENYDMDGADIEGGGREIPDSQKIQTSSILAKLIYQLNPNNEIGLTASYYKKNPKTDTKSFNGGWYSNRMGDDTSKVTRIGLFHELTSENSWFDKMTTEFNKQSNEFEAKTTQHVTFSFGPTFSADEDRISIRSFDQDLLQFTVDFEKSLKINEQVHNIIYGLKKVDKEYENKQLRTANSTLDDLGWVDSNDGALIPTSNADIYTFYAMDTFNLSNSTQVRLGARYDSYTYDAQADENYPDDTDTLGKVSFSTATWTIGIEQQLSAGLSLELGVSTGFRAPTIEEMYQTSGDIDDWSKVPNKDLEAEYSTNIDIALVGEFDVIEFRLGAFYSKYDDFIDYETQNGINTNTGIADPDGYIVPVNSGEVDIKGIELSTNINLSKAFALSEGFSTGAQAAYTNGESNDDVPVYSIQPFNLTWSFNYNQPKGLWGAALYASHTSGKENKDSFSFATDGSGAITNEKVYPLYLSNTATIIDASAYYNFTDSLRITGGIYNLTDKEYYRWDSVSFVDQGDLRPGIGVIDDGIKRYSEPGRSFKITINYQF